MKTLQDIPINYDIVTLIAITSDLWLCMSFYFEIAHILSSLMKE